MTGKNSNVSSKDFFQPRISKRTRSDDNEENNSDDVGKLSLQQWQEAMGALLDSKNLATKQDVQEIVASQVEPLYEENKKLREDIEDMKHKIDTQDKIINQMQNELRKKNLIIKGLKLGEEDNKKQIGQFIKEKLELNQEPKIDAVKKLGNPESCKTIVVSLNNEDEKTEILRKAWKLKGSSISLQEDLTINTRQQRFYLLRIKRELTAYNNNIKSKLSREALIVNSKRFMWEEGNGLMYNGENGILMLKDITGYDASKLIQELVNQSKNKTT